MANENTYTTFQFTGLADLYEALRNLPEALADEANAILEDETKAAADEIIAKYPEVTGNLKGGVKWSIKTSPYGAIGRVVSGAPHAYIYETGTASRQTDLGYDRGAMPGKHIFIPTMIEHRRKLEDALADMLRRFGLQVERVHGVGPL
jgi:hypothetical protein